MTGDSERDFDNDANVGEPTPANPPSNESAEDTARVRPFRSWGAAQQEEGVLEKIGKRISGIFAKKKVDEVEPESVEGPELTFIELPAASDDALIETVSSMDPQSAAPEPEPLIDPAAASVPDENFAPEIASVPELISMPEPEPETPAIPSVEEEPVVMWTPDAPPPPKRPSFIGRLFGWGKKPTAPPPEPVSEMTPPPVMGTPTSTPVVETAPAMELSDPTALEPFEAVAPIESAEPPVEEPLAEAPLAEELLVEEPLAEEPLPPMELSVEAVPEEPKRGLFSRLFGRKPKPAPIDEFAAPMAEPLVEPVLEQPVADEPMLDDHRIGAEEPSVAEEPLAAEIVEVPIEAIAPDEELVRTDEHEVPAPDEIVAPQPEPFASVEDALPVDVSEETQSFDALPAAEAPEAPKLGLFSRLFGRKSKPVRPSLEIEVHEDRIEAAAHALDEVSGESFASASTDAPAEETFASVEDALPAGETAADEMPADETPAEAASIGPDLMRFAPPPVSEPVESRSTLEIEPFDPFAQRTDDRDTVETTADSRSTMEMERHEPRSTEELNLELEQQQDFSDTLEVDEKTDEFAIPDVDVERTTDEVDQPEDAATTTELARQTWWAKLLGIKPKVVAKKPPAGATVVEGNPNFLFSKFRAFYNEIIRLKHQKTEFTAGFATAIVTDYAADLSPDAAAASQSQALAQMLELQLAEANWMGGEARERYPDAQYAMAALADEIFTHVEWDGQSAWKNHLLEVRLFRSRAADVELFKRIDKLLKDRPNSHVARDLARVYLLVVAAGFQGKYRPFGLTRALAEYRQRLYEFIHQGDALMLFAPERRIFPEAAQRTLEGHAVSRFSGAQRWAAILILMVLGYTALAHYAWNRVSADLKDVTERIRAASSTSTSGTATSPSSSNTTGAR